MTQASVTHIPAKEITIETRLYFGTRDINYHGELHRNVLHVLRPALVRYDNGFVHVIYKDYSPLGVSGFSIDENVSVPVVTYQEEV